MLLCGNSYNMSKFTENYIDRYRCRYRYTDMLFER